MMRLHRNCQSLGYKSFRKFFILSITVVSLVDCHSNPVFVTSKGMSRMQRIETIKKVIVPKSEIIDAEFILYNVNFSDSLPGASSANYKIFLQVKPSDTIAWTKDKQSWMISSLKNQMWMNDLMSNSTLLKEIEGTSCETYFKQENGYEYTLCSYSRMGVIFIKYIQK